MTSVDPAPLVPASFSFSRSFSLSRLLFLSPVAPTPAPLKAASNWRDAKPMTGRDLRGGAADVVGTGGAAFDSTIGGAVEPPEMGGLGPVGTAFDCGGRGALATFGDFGGTCEGPPEFLGIGEVTSGVAGGGGAGGGFLFGFLLVPWVVGSAGFAGSPFFFGSSLRGALEPIFIWSL